LTCDIFDVDLYIKSFFDLSQVLRLEPVGEGSDYSQTIPNPGGQFPFLGGLGASPQPKGPWDFKCGDWRRQAWVLFTL